LDERERGGYVRAVVTAVMRDEPERPVNAATWIAAPDNPYYLGPASLDVMAEQIRGTVGPSGSNREYVLQLAATLRALGIEDPHVTAVARALGEHSVDPATEAAG
jgi:cation transport regulator ChaC